MLNYAKIMLFCQHLAFHKYVDYKDSYEVLIATLIGFLRTDRMNEKRNEQINKWIQRRKYKVNP